MRTILALFLTLILTSCVQASEYRILFFNASWCGPCKKMKSSWEDKEVRKALLETKLGLFDIDYDKNEKLASDYGVNAVPTTVIVELNEQKKGEVKAKHEGYMDGKKLAKFIRDTLK